MVYAGSSRALCQLEKRAHCNGVQPLDQALMRLDLPDDAVVMEIRPAGLPDNWREDEAWTQAAGVRWRALGVSLGLWVPSAVTITVERNPFLFDQRLF